MQKSYEDILLDANISYDEMISNQYIPPYLYKYQSFFSPELIENKYWRDNLRGTFHLSLGKEFEDENDCKPYFKKSDVCSIIIDSLLHFGLSHEHVNKILAGLNSVLTQEYFESILSNFRGEIRVGCFTKSSDNSDLWKKYANNETGYCLEYQTSNSFLFKHSILPVLYSEKAYNSSLSLANMIILAIDKQINNCDTSEQFEIFKSDYAKIVKTAYVPLFIKERSKWSFEEEYRLFLLKNRSTQIGMLEADDYLDENANINLSNSISKIYLGKNFEKNINHDILKNEINCIANEMGIKVIQKQ